MRWTEPVASLASCLVLEQTSLPLLPSPKLGASQEADARTSKGEGTFPWAPSCISPFQ